MLSKHKYKIINNYITLFLGTYLRGGASVQKLVQFPQIFTQQIQFY